jgi:hypothetical protein
VLVTLQIAHQQVVVAASSLLLFWDWHLVIQKLLNQQLAQVLRGVDKRAALLD